MTAKNETINQIRRGVANETGKHVDPRVRIDVMLPTYSKMSKDSMDDIIILGVFRCIHGVQ